MRLSTKSIHLYLPKEMVLESR